MTTVAPPPGHGRANSVWDETASGTLPELHQAKDSSLVHFARIKEESIFGGSLEVPRLWSGSASSPHSILASTTHGQAHWTPDFWLGSLVGMWAYSTLNFCFVCTCAYLTLDASGCCPQQPSKRPTGSHFKSSRQDHFISLPKLDS